ncbi:MAG: acetyl-CoA acetyltransferase [Chloroflexi bacterium]|nr:acetyl-CoA acetyltransferase [Chloroflexota bacterium]
MESMKDKVAIIGMGRTEAGELWNNSMEDLLVDACEEAIKDAGIDRRDIQAGFLGCYLSLVSGLLLNRALKFDWIPTTRIENACATGGDTFRTACAFVASGMYDMVIAAGVDKQKDSGATGQQDHGGIGTNIGIPSPPPAPVGAVAAMRYAHHYGMTMEELKRILGRIAIKNHHNGSLTPQAQYRKDITFEQYLNAPMMAYPLGLLDCCGVADGAAAAIITRPEIAKHITDNYVVLKGLGASTGGSQAQLQQQGDFVHWEENILASRVAYGMAGVKDPMKDICHAEVHDAFTIVELISLEDVGLAPRGRGGELVLGGFYDLEGQVPVNTDGGLKCNGHPIGATGLIQIYECFRQMQGKAGPRQVKNPTLSMAHNQGGSAGGGVHCTVALLSPRD